MVGAGLTKNVAACTPVHEKKKNSLANQSNFMRGQKFRKEQSQLESAMRSGFKNLE